VCGSPLSRRKVVDALFGRSSSFWITRRAGQSPSRKRIRRRRVPYAANEAGIEEPIAVGAAPSHHATSSVRRTSCVSADTGACCWVGACRRRSSICGLVVAVVPADTRHVARGNSREAPGFGRGECHFRVAHRTILSTARICPTIQARVGHGAGSRSPPGPPIALGFRQEDAIRSGSLQKEVSACR